MHSFLFVIKPLLEDIFHQEIDALVCFFAAVVVIKVLFLIKTSHEVKLLFCERFQLNLFTFSLDALGSDVKQFPDDELISKKKKERSPPYSPGFLHRVPVTLLRARVL